MKYYNIVYLLLVHTSGHAMLSIAQRTARTSLKHSVSSSFVVHQRLFSSNEDKINELHKEWLKYRDEYVALKHERDLLCAKSHDQVYRIIEGKNTWWNRILSYKRKNRLESIVQQMNKASAVMGTINGQMRALTKECSVKAI